MSERPQIQVACFAPNSMVFEHRMHKLVDAGWTPTKRRFVLEDPQGTFHQFLWLRPGVPDRLRGAQFDRGWLMEDEVGSARFLWKADHWYEMEYQLKLNAQRTGYRGPMWVNYLEGE